MTLPLQEKIREIYRDLTQGPKDRIRFIPAEGGHVLVALASRTFDAMDEVERQDLVWGRILDHLDVEDQSRVDFVFTDTPDEVDAAAEAVED